MIRSFILWLADTLTLGRNSSGVTFGEAIEKGQKVAAGAPARENSISRAMKERGSRP